VARATHVRVDPTVSPVGSTSHLGSTVDLILKINKNKFLKTKKVHLDVLDDQVVSVQPLVLGIALGVLQHVEEELG
jgi:hypothetical protein